MSLHTRNPTTGAKARIYFQRLSGTSGTRALPFPCALRVFQQPASNPKSCLVEARSEWLAAGTTYPQPEPARSLGRDHATIYPSSFSDGSDGNHSHAGYAESHRRQFSVASYRNVLRAV